MNNIWESEIFETQKLNNLVEKCVSIFCEVLFQRWNLSSLKNGAKRRKAYKKQKLNFIFHNNENNNKYTSTDLFSKIIYLTHVILQYAIFTEIMSLERKFLTPIWKPCILYSAFMWYICENLTTWIMYLIKKLRCDVFFNVYWLGKTWSATQNLDLIVCIMII